MATFEVLKADEALVALRAAEAARGRAEMAALTAEQAVASLAVMGGSIARTNRAALDAEFAGAPVNAQGIDLSTGEVFLKTATATDWGLPIGVLSFQSTVTLPAPAPSDSTVSNEWAPAGGEWAPAGGEWAPA